MRSPARPLVLILLLAAGGAAMAAGSPAQREYASARKALAGLTPGRPQSCLSLDRTRESRFLDRDTIAYRDTARRWYVNRTTAGCSFDDDTIIVSSTPSTQLCRGDILQLVDRTIRAPRGSCILGDFVPYTR